MLHETIQKVREGLDNLEQKIVELEGKVETSQAEAKQTYKQEVEKLKLKKTEVQNQLQGLKEKGEGASEELASGLKNAFAELKTSVEQAIEKIKQ